MKQIDNIIKLIPHCVLKEAITSTQVIPDYYNTISQIYQFIPKYYNHNHMHGSIQINMIHNNINILTKITIVIMHMNAMHITTS